MRTGIRRLGEPGTCRAQGQAPLPLPLRCLRSGECREPGGLMRRAATERTPALRFAQQPGDCVASAVSTGVTPGLSKRPRSLPTKSCL